MKESKRGTFSGKKHTQSEERLQISQASLKAIIDTAVDGIITIDARGMVQSFNPAAERLFQYKPEEVIGNTINNLMPSPYKEDHDRYMQNYLTTGIRKIIGIGREVVARRKDGTTFPIFLSVGEFIQGNERRFTGIIRDISVLKAAEEKLKKSNEALTEQVWSREGQALLANHLRGELSVPEICQSALTFLCEYVNAQIGALYASQDGTLTRTATYAYSISNGKETFQFGEGVIGQAAKQIKTVHLKAVPQDYIKVSSALGDTVPGSLLVVPITCEGKVEGVLELASLSEFTSRQEEFLAGVAESIGVGIRSSKSRRVQELLEETQRQAEELQVQQEELRTTNEELEEQTKALKQSESRLQGQQEELQQINEELEERSKALQEQREDLHKKNEELARAQGNLIEQARELQQSGKYKSEFLANMSHELRTPLNSILILAKLLSENKGGTLSKEQVEFSETIHSSGTDLINLINDILDLSKVEAGKLSLHPEKIALSEVGHSLEQTFKVVAKERKLDYEVELTDGLPQTFVTDKARLDQILRNFLSNAFKFTQKGGVKLRIYRPDVTEVKSMNLEPIRNPIAFAVSDTGIGIPKEKQEVIFDAFCQMDGTTSRKYGGTGLGLTISRELASLLGAEIRLTSEEEKGTTFTLYSPEHWSKEKEKATGENRPAAQEANREVLPRPQVPPVHPKQVSESPIPDDRTDLTPTDRVLLIIDDDLKFARILMKLAHERGLKGIVAEDGETGLALLKHYSIHGVLLDLRLPGIHGFEVLERMKADPKTRHIPVHIISISEDHIEPALQQGAIGFLKKPISQETLAQAFERIENLTTKKFKKLLIVEDNKAQREAIAKLIGNGDVHTTVVGTAGAAHDYVQTEKPDCIIMDLGLPDYSGFELLEQIAQDKTMIPPPIIVYTGRDLTREEEEQLQLYSKSIIIKGARSPERLLDEAMLFLHRVEGNLPQEKRQILVKLRNEVFEGKKVLVVDDDMRNVYALTKTLEDRGLSVSVAKNGKQALSRLEEEPDTHAVLMDIMMPEMDGYEATQEIRKQNRFRNLPVIALTAKAMKEDREKCLLAGANDYIPKPVDVDQLMTLLRVWMNRRV
ncbi:MAG: response regulator [Deltaproteobacteria bacterium]|nr:response regulator [Deltaproteobacteria bacterium]